MDNEDLFTKICKAELGVEVIKEHKFYEGRKWRFDYAIPEFKIAIEIEGGVWTMGRHTRPQGFLKDMEKYNTATCMGWKLLRFTPDELLNTKTLNLIRETITQK
jgi:very-short-patch-repair endonuclease